MADNTKNSGSLQYPLSKMNFVVSVDSKVSAVFSEVTGLQATVDVIEFREGNSNSMSPMKMPGLVKHGNLTLKMGLILDSDFKTWVINCVKDSRTEFERKDIIIELMDVRGKTPTAELTGVGNGGAQWKLHDCWPAKYSAPDLNANQSGAAIETVEIAYESLEIIPKA